MGEWLNHLDFWLAVFGIGAMLYFLVWKDHLQPFFRGMFPPGDPAPPEEPARARVRTRSLLRRRPRPRPIRVGQGRFAGSVAAGTIVPEERNEPERGSDDRSASESAVPGDNEVPVVPIFVPEIVQITAQLVRGVPPSDVAKTLPGYSGRNYRTYMARVQAVKAELDRVPQEEETPHA